MLDALDQRGFSETTPIQSAVLPYALAGRDVACGNNYMMGIRDEGLLAQHQEACKTLAKK